MLISSWFSSACTAITRPKLQIPNFFMLQHNTTQHKNAVRLSRWEADYRCVKEAMVMTVHVHLRRRAFSSAAGAWHCQTSSLGCLTGARLWRVFLWISSGTLDRISRPMIPRAVPCWPGWRLPFVSKPLLTSSSYCHVVSWGSCHGEQSPSLQTTTGLITGTICTPGRITEKSFPEGMFIVMVAEINLILTNIYSKGGSLYSQLVKQDSSSLSWLF